ncbi:penicillin-binding protein [Patescibacteria group bacterium]|nr:MAG: penicillin-binding protein [Patescibacteria group bacterium]
MSRFRFTKRQAIAAAVACLATVFGFALWSVVPTLGAPPLPVPTTVLASDGSVLYEANASDEETAAPVALDAMPPRLIEAVLAAEDKRFYAHHGIDWLALARAAKDDVVAGRVVSGGSTIEQQIIKNQFFPGEPRTVIQKARELVAARWWSLTHAKDATLERYLNSVYLGNNVSGVQAASREYFHKEATDLSLPEAALLAGVIGAPTRYDPIRHPSAARERQQFVLDRMRELDEITSEEADEASDAPIATFAPRHDLHAPHFVFRVLDLLDETYPDLLTGGYAITTTLDPALQSVAEDSVFRQLGKLTDSHVTNAAAVAVDPGSGEVLAYVGGADYWDEGIDGAVNMAAAKRQPGSALKPFAYFAAFMRGIITPGTLIDDAPVRYDVPLEGQSGTGVYVPRNYGYKLHGLVAARDALGSSLNIPAVKVVDALGLNAFFGTLARFGLVFPEAPEHYGLGIVLGGGEVTLEEATNAYAALSRATTALPLSFVREVRDRHGAVVSVQASAPREMFEPFDRLRARQAAALVTDILSDKTARALSFGETSRMEIGKPVAAKTGTTKDFRDNWAFGYTSDFALGVWAGNADNSPMYGVSGVSGAIPIWHDIMAFRYRYADPAARAGVSGLVSRDLCLETGLLATPSIPQGRPEEARGATASCEKTRTELFIGGTEPDAATQAEAVILAEPSDRQVRSLVE